MDSFLYIPAVKKLRHVVILEELVNKLLPSTAHVLETSKFKPDILSQGQWSKERTNGSTAVYSPKQGYHSIFSLNKESLVNYMEAHEGSLSGYIPNYDTEGVYGHWFIMDFDDKTVHLTEILKRIDSLMKYLHKHNIEHKLFSSGNKGVHLYIPFKYFTYPDSFKNKMHEVAKAACLMIKEKFGLDKYDKQGSTPTFFVDESIYLPMAFIRAPYSLNQKGMKPKILLDYHYGVNAASEGLTLSNFATPVVLHKSEVASLLYELNTEYEEECEPHWEIEPEERKVVVRDRRDIVTDKWIPKYGDEYCIPRMLNDDMPAQRHNTALRIMGWLYNKGMPIEIAYDIIVSWNNHLVNPMATKEVEELMRSYGKYYWGCTDFIKKSYCPQNNICSHWKTQKLLGNIYDSKQAMIKMEEYLERDESNDINLSHIYPGYESWLIPDEGHIITIGSAPGVGKSYAALNLALKVDCGVLFFSNEMSIHTIQKRIASMLDLNIHDPQDRKTVVSMTKNIYVEDLGITPLDKHVEIKEGLEEKYKTRIGLIIVDYIQITKVLESNSKTRIIEDPRRACMQIAVVAKSYAKQGSFNYCFLSQVPKGVSNNGNTFISSEDLKDSQSIEAMSDLIITMWRPNKEIIGKQDNVLIMYGAKDRNYGFVGKILAYSWFTGNFNGLIQEPAFNNDYQIRYNKTL